jgi:hypothetical protein
MSTSNKPLSKAIVLAGFTTGTLDILSALTSVWLRNSTTPVTVLKVVASGVFGIDALSGGAMIAADGLLFHYVIAFSWAALFFMLYSRVSILRGRPCASVDHLRALCVAGNEPGGAAIVKYTKIPFQTDFGNHWLMYSNCCYWPAKCVASQKTFWLLKNAITPL